MLAKLNAQKLDPTRDRTQGKASSYFPQRHSHVLRDWVVDLLPFTSGHISGHRLPFSSYSLSSLRWYHAGWFPEPTLSSER